MGEIIVLEDFRLKQEIKEMMKKIIKIYKDIKICYIYDCDYLEINLFKGKYKGRLRIKECELKYISIINKETLIKTYIKQFINDCYKEIEKEELLK